MLSLANFLALCSLVLHICTADGYVAVTKAGPSAENNRISARSFSREIVSSNVHRRQTKFVNRTSFASAFSDETLDITCFRSSEELQLNPVKIPDCARIIRDLTSVIAPDAELSWGTSRTKAPDYVIPYTLPARGSCIATVDPWPPGSDYASDTFSTNYLGHIMKEIIVACLTGDEPYGGTVVFGPMQYMRLTLSGPLPGAGTIGEFDAAGQNRTIGKVPEKVSLATS